MGGSSSVPEKSESAPDMRVCELKPESSNQINCSSENKKIEYSWCDCNEANENAGKYCDDAEDDDDEDCDEEDEEDDEEDEEDDEEGVEDEKCEGRGDDPCEDRIGGRVFSPCRDPVIKDEPSTNRTCTVYSPCRDPSPSITPTLDGYFHTKSNLEERGRRGRCTPSKSSSCSNIERDKRRDNIDRSGRFSRESQQTSESQSRSSKTCFSTDKEVVSSRSRTEGGEKSDDDQRKNRIGGLVFSPCRDPVIKDEPSTTRARKLFSPCRDPSPSKTPTLDGCFDTKYNLEERGRRGRCRPSKSSSCSNIEKDKRRNGYSRESQQTSESQSRSSKTCFSTDKEVDNSRSSTEGRGRCHRDKTKLQSRSSTSSCTSRERKDNGKGCTDSESRIGRYSRESQQTSESQSRTSKTCFSTDNEVDNSRSSTEGGKKSDDDHCENRNGGRVFSPCRDVDNCRSSTKGRSKCRRDKTKLQSRSSPSCCTSRERKDNGRSCTDSESILGRQKREECHEQKKSSDSSRTQSKDTSRIYCRDGTTAPKANSVCNGIGEYDTDLDSNDEDYFAEKETETEQCSSQKMLAKCRDLPSLKTDYHTTGVDQEREALEKGQFCKQTVRSVTDSQKPHRAIPYIKCKGKKRYEDEEKKYGEKIKDLQKGCAYLSKKELRQVCDKYKNYGHFKTQSCSPSKRGGYQSSSMANNGSLSDEHSSSECDQSGEFGPFSLTTSLTIAEQSNKNKTSKLVLETCNNNKTTSLSPKMKGEGKLYKNSKSESSDYPSVGRIFEHEKVEKKLRSLKEERDTGNRRPPRSPGRKKYVITTSRALQLKKNENSNNSLRGICTSPESNSKIDRDDLNSESVNDEEEMTEYTVGYQALPDRSHVDELWFDCIENFDCCATLETLTDTTYSCLSSTAETKPGVEYYLTSYKPHISVHFKSEKSMSGSCGSCSGDGYISIGNTNCNAGTSMRKKKQRNRAEIAGHEVHSQSVQKLNHHIPEIQNAASKAKFEQTGFIVEQEYRRQIPEAANQDETLLDFDQARALELNDRVVKQLLAPGKDLQADEIGISKITQGSSFNVDQIRVNSFKGQARQRSTSSSHISKEAHTTGAAAPLGIHPSQLKILWPSLTTSHKREQVTKPVHAKEMYCEQYLPRFHTNQPLCCRFPTKNIDVEERESNGNTERAAVQESRDTNQLGLKGSKIRQLFTFANAKAVENVTHEKTSLNPYLAKALGLNRKEMNKTFISTLLPNNYLDPNAKQQSDGFNQEKDKSQNKRVSDDFYLEATSNNDLKDDGSQQKWKKALFWKLQKSDGEEIIDTLSTLLEWNSILLFVIFVLLLAISCPGAANAFLPCPLPSIYRGLEYGRQHTAKCGSVYSTSYYLIISTFDLGCTIFSNVIYPIFSLPIRIMWPFLAALSSAIVCTIRTASFAIFYSCGNILGIKIPHDFSQQPWDTRVASATQGGKAAVGGVGLHGPTEEKASRIVKDTPKPEKEVSQKPKPDPDMDASINDDIAMSLTDEDGTLSPDLQNLHQYGGFFFYMGFDPPKKGCNFSSITTSLMWLFGNLPKECAT